MMRPRTTLAATLLVVTVMISVASCGTGGPTSLMLTDEELTSAATLNIGDPAPQLTIDEWIKGQPVERFEPGTVYVIDFWASWCGPCQVSFGRSSTLQEKFGPRVVVVAVSAVDGSNPAGAVRRVARRRDADMRFRIALDRGQTANAYMRAARQTAIPRSFIVDGTGRLVWIGRSPEAEPVVQAVLDGAWDAHAAADELRKQTDERARSRPLVSEWFAAEETKDPAKELPPLEALSNLTPEYIALSPSFATEVARVGVLVQLGRAQDATRAARAAAEKRGVREHAWGIARLASALDPAVQATADSLAQRALAMLDQARQAEDSNSGDDWDRFVREGDRRWNGEAYNVLSGLRARHGRYAEAAELMALSIERTDERMTQDLAARQKLLDDYRAKAGG